MEYANISVSFTYIWLESPGFLKEVALNVVRTVSLCGSLQNRVFFFNAQSHFTLTALHKHFLCHPWHYTRDTLVASDWIGQCLLPQTSRLASCDSALGRLPNSLGTLHSGPTCVNIFLTRVYRKSLCEIFSSPHEEWRM